MANCIRLRSNVPFERSRSAAIVTVGGGGKTGGAVPEPEPPSGLVCAAGASEEDIAGARARGGRCVTSGRARFDCVHVQMDQMAGSRVWRLSRAASGAREGDAVLCAE